jgi:tellurite resistance protein TehA-like permease
MNTILLLADNAVQGWINLAAYIVFVGVLILFIVIWFIVKLIRDDFRRQKKEN